MPNYPLSYREVIPDQTVLDPWKEISLNTGGTQGTLQDIKVAERANGYSYRDSGRHHTRNRFIYWRISHDVLELVEHSLDVNLSGNRLRYRFVDTPILDGVSIHETYDNVVILVPTVCSVHRLVFPHPDKCHRQDDALGTHPDLAAPSVFFDACIKDARDASTFHFFTSSSSASSQSPHLADSLLAPNEEAIFVLAYLSGETILVKQAKNGRVETSELKGDSLVPKFLSGIADKLCQKDKDGDMIVSLLLHTFGLESYVLTLCRNGQLKFWSCTKCECVSAIDILSETDNLCTSQMQGTQNHILRKAANSDETECLLGIFASFSTRSQLHIFKPVVNNSQIRLLKINSLHSPQSDLIDFTLSTDRIWSVWRGKDGDCEVYTSVLQTVNNWTPVILEDTPDAEQPPNVDGETDPGQAYLQAIFHPGQFPVHIISKALNIYKRSTVISDNLSSPVLKQQIRMAVEEEIQSELKETVVSDEDYLECANYCWQRFYSCCIQYHVAGLKPLGVLVLPCVSGAVLLKKSTVSILRPLDLMEHLFLCNNYVYSDQLNVLNENDDTTEDIMKLFEVVVYLEQQLSANFAYTFEKGLALLKSPENVMAVLLEKIQNEMDNEFTDYVAKMLGQCRDLYQAIHKILEMLRMENQIQGGMSSHIIGQVFASQLGISVVTGCLRQQIFTRFSICRNILLIIKILLERKELEWNVLEAIRSVCMPETIVLTQANFVMVWLSNLPALPFLPLETCSQRLSSLKLSPVFNLRNNTMNSISLLELFVGSTGGYEARKKLMVFGENEICWHLTLLPYVNNLYYVTWPVCGSPVLAEWLLSCGQHLWLQQYVRLLSNWCEWNNCTHKFLLAASLLSTGENYKAQELFQLAAKGIFSEAFLAQRILSDDNDQTRSYVNYYLKVINLFELHKSYDCAINLANTALTVIDPKDQLASTLHSIKFKLNLTLRNYEMAFDSLNANPDDERKKDNLRDLVKKLLDEKKFDVLLKFTFGRLEELFVDILFIKARGTDAFHNIYYDFLYAYIVNRGPSFLRLAASVAYEQGYRLSQVDNIEALEKQVRCYIAAKNGLQLVDPKFAWIVMPNDPIEEQYVNLPLLDMEITIKKNINIINLDGVTKDSVFASAKLKLFKFNPKTFTEITSPNELMVLLTAAGLFRTALRVCQTFNLSSRTAFEVLTKKCGNLTKHDDPAAWKWLIENDLQDLPNNAQSASLACWQLLQDCMQQYEEDKLSYLHKIVCRQLIKMHMFIPYWLLASYKMRNPGELLQLLYNAGRLEEAVELATELMMAVMGHGKEYYGFSMVMQPTASPFCLPINGIVTLLEQLKLLNENDPEKPLVKEYEHLKGVFQTYTQTALRTSNEMCHYKMSLVDN